MKKIFALILAAVMCFSVMALASCSEDLVPIGVQTGTTGQYFVDGDADWGFDGIDGYEAKGYNNGGLAVAAMKNGNVKYVVIDREPALQLAKTVSGIKVVDIPLTVEEYAFGVDKAQPNLRTQINTILADMKANGKLEAIFAAYATGEGITPITPAEFDANRPDEQFVVATNAAFAPFEYKEGNQFAGVDMEIAAYIAQQLGMELVIKDMKFDAVVTSVGTNGVDVAMAGLTVNDERKQSVDFTDSYYNAAQVLIIPADNKAFDNCTTKNDVLAALKSELDK